MPETVIFTTATCEIWEPTMALRWHRRAKATDDADVLEQAWFCRSSGKEEWRAIPIVYR